MYGILSGRQRVQVPRRVFGKEKNYIALNDEDYQYLKEDLEIVHPGLTEDPQEGQKIGLDF